jgi:ABC-2 type transport system permease protein
VKAIIQFELLQIKRNRVSVLLVTAVCLLLVLSLIISWNYYQWYSKLQQEVSHNARHHWETQGEKNSHSAAHFGIYLFKPVSALSVWDSGIDKYYGVSLYIEAHIRNQLQLKAIEDNPLLARWGELTPATMLLVLLPLLLLWLASSSVVNDRVNGTFKLLLLQGASTRQLIWGKALALWCISVTIILGIWLAGGIMASVLSGQSFFDASSLSLLMLYILYAGIFIQAGLLISLKAKSPRAALVTALSIWLVAVWLVPRLFVQWSEAKYTAPDTEQFVAKIKSDIALNGLNSHGAGGSKEKELERQWLQKYGVDSVQQLPLNWLGVVLQADEEINNPIYDKHYDSLYAGYRKQLDIHSISGWLSPLMPAKSASMAFAGTNLHNSIHFYQQTEAYRKTFIKKLNDRLRDNSRYGGRDTGRSDFWKSAPVFKYTSPCYAEKWKHAKGYFFNVTGWLLALLVITHLTAKKVSVVSGSSATV